MSDELLSALPAVDAAAVERWSERLGFGRAGWAEGRSFYLGQDEVFNVATPIGGVTNLMLHEQEQASLPLR